MQSNTDMSNMNSAIERVLSTLSFPIDKDEIIQHARVAGANPQIVNSMAQILPDELFHSAEDVKKVIRRSQARM